MSHKKWNGEQERENLSSMKLVNRSKQMRVSAVHVFEERINENFTHLNERHESEQQGDQFVHLHRRHPHLHGHLGIDPRM